MSIQTAKSTSWQLWEHRIKFASLWTLKAVTFSILGIARTLFAILRVVLKIYLIVIGVFLISMIQT